MKRLELLDYARFFAALSVILFHYSFNGISNGKISSLTADIGLTQFTKYGYLGVEFFFLISGFVILASVGNRSAGAFAFSRCLRLFPAYWVGVTITSVFAFCFGGSLMSVSPGQVLLNYTMLHSFFGVSHVDGVYWTLVYELKFYALIFAFILLGGQRLVERFFLIWPILMAIAVTCGLEGLPYLGGYFYFFSCGGLFYLLYKSKSPLIKFSLFVSCLLCLKFSYDYAGIKSVKSEVIISDYIVLCIVALFFAFFLFLISRKGSSLKLPYASYFGGITYPLYLVHAHIGYMLIDTYASDEGKYLTYLLVFLFVVLLSSFIHVVVERNMKTFWQVFFKILIFEPVKYVESRVNFRVSGKEGI